MKKLSFAVLLILAVCLLGGCYPGMLHSELKITSEAGAGTQTVYIEILKDHAQRPDGGGPVTDNSTFFPNGIEPVTDFMENNVPAGYQLDFYDQSDQYIYAITYSFTDIDDYNDKTKALVGINRWNTAGLEEATLVKNGSEVTISIDPYVLEQIGRRFMEPVYNDPDLFDPQGVPIEYIYEISAFAIDIGGHVKLLEWDSENPVDKITHYNVIGDGPDNKFTTGVSVSLSAVDDLTGVVKTEYRINGGSWTTYTGPFNLTADGVYLIDYRSYDLAGNMEEYKTIRIEIEQ